MAHYILEFQGAEPREDDVALIEGSPGVAVIDRIARAFLVDVSDDGARALRDRLPDWTVEPEVIFPPPETS